MDSSVISCPPCRSPERCVGLVGQCGMALDKLAASPTPKVIPIITPLLKPGRRWDPK